MSEKQEKYYKGKIAIVTGGASGIGLSLCQKLSRYGATVVVADLDIDGADKAAKSINASGGSDKAAKIDVGDVKEVEHLVNSTVDEYGRLDFMFNNAGIAILGEIRDMNMAQWEKLIKIN